ncbi:hypothetical protein ACFQYP_03155 [Nonomuraea antimicrobica]
MNAGAAAGGGTVGLRAGRAVRGLGVGAFWGAFLGVVGPDLVEVLVGHRAEAQRLLPR